MAQNILVDFLNNSLSEACLFPVHSLQDLFGKRIMQIERRANSVLKYYIAQRNMLNGLKRELEMEKMKKASREFLEPCFQRDQSNTAAIEGQWVQGG